MSYSSLSLKLSDINHAELVIALIQQFDMDSIWEDGNIIHVYFKTDVLDDTIKRAEILKTIEPFIDSFTEQKVEEKNWNRDWESNFPTVEIDDFCYIFADFHPVKNGFKHYIKIAPKMAFGTGHHETTFMMIQDMASIDFKNKSVLDLGCGTGILSVLAKQLGAGDLVAIDIEKPSYDNTIEHAEINNVEFEVLCGGVEDVPEKKFNVVLANINRTVLLHYSKQIIGFIEEGGDLLLSGVLEKDLHLIKDAYSDLDLINIKQKNQWRCLHYKRKGN